MKFLVPEKMDFFHDSILIRKLYFYFNVKKKLFFGDLTFYQGLLITKKQDIQKKSTRFSLNFKNFKLFLASLM